MESNEEYAEFLKKVERTIYIDNISPEVTESVLKAAFNQFGSVTAVQFIHAYLQPNGVHAVLVEMADRKQAEDIVSGMANFPLMIGAMPRPVQAKIATLEMFSDRPRKPGRRIRCRWLQPRDPMCEVAKKIQKMVRRNADEISYLLEQQLAEEEKLAKMQSETLRTNSKKLELIEGVDESLKQLAYHYGVGDRDGAPAPSYKRNQI